MNQRTRAIIWAAAALTGIWVVAATGWWIAQQFKITPEKVRAYVESVDLSKLTGDARAKAIQKLVDQLNALSFQDRQRLRVERTAYGWFEAMTEAEKAEFIEATLPTGFKQMITAFEEMPEERRRRAIDDSLRRLREANQRMQSGELAMGRGTNAPPISEELEAQVRTIGLKTFYSQSSAQTKAELAPVLEELQRAMESGRAMRGR